MCDRGSGEGEKNLVLANVNERIIVDSQLIYMFAANADLVAKLVRRRARFVIVGGVAVRFYLPERLIDDLDLLIDPTTTNAELVVDAINSGGLCYYPFEKGALAKRNIRCSIRNYYYADILTPNAGINFENVWATSIEAEVVSQPLPTKVRVAGISTLIEMLRPSEEERHKRDIESLGRLDDLQKQKG
jgi:hypothetical protein